MPINLSSTVRNMKKLHEGTSQYNSLKPVILKNALQKGMDKTVFICRGTKIRKIVFFFFFSFKG